MHERRPLRSVLVPLVAAVLAAVTWTGVSAQDPCSGIAPVEPSDLVKVDVIDNLPGQPLFLVSPPGDRDRRFVVDQSGRILLHRRGDAPTVHSLVLDLTAVAGGLGNETGLLGLAFDPDFDPDTPGDDFFWVNYTEALDQFGFNVQTVVARYRMDPNDPDVADSASEQRVLTLDQPQTNHNAGWMAFGDDGMLYVATGDGGGGGDPHGDCGNGQNEDNALGAILRLDVRDVDPESVAPECAEPGATYRVPSDNPFVGQDGCDELWVFGLRNPWRNAFDPANGDLYVADVGQGCWEEVNWVDAASAPGTNFGWRQMEGEHCYDGLTCDPEMVTCDLGMGEMEPPCFDPSLRLPVTEYVNSQQAGGEGCSVTGGYVYRGCRMPSFAGTYFYGDYCTGFVRSFRIAGGAATDPQDWTANLGVSIANNLTSFGQDAEGEVFLVERTGAVSKIVPPFGDIPVSGAGARSFLLSNVADWTWEDLGYTSEYPVQTYKVYRGLPGGTFTCVQQTLTPSWTGDPDVPAAGELFAYIVTATLSGGEESSSGDPPRTLSPDPCQ